MNPQNPEDIDEMAGEYVLGTLSAARRREVEQRLPGNAALQGARAAVAGVLAAAGRAGRSGRAFRSTVAPD